MNIYTLGYSGWKIEDVEAVVKRLEAVLVDVRMVARSRAPTWNGASLARRLGDRYVWLRSFGNRNYKGTVEQIEIVDFPAGEQRLRELLGVCLASNKAAAKTIILFCGCPDVSQCHRRILAEWLGQAWGAEVQHLTRPDNQISSGQSMLF